MSNDAQEQTARRRPLELTAGKKWALAGIGAGAAVVAAIGFAGSYQALHHLAETKGFHGKVAAAFPIGIDVGIIVLLAWALLATWMRLPNRALPPLAWLLTAGTVWFNASTAWPDGVGVGMHAAMPILFVIMVDSVQHTIATAALKADGLAADAPPAVRWIIAPRRTLLMWRRMRLWNVAAYTDAVAHEREMRIFTARMRHRHGRRWRRHASEPEVLAALLARDGVPIADTLAEGQPATSLTAPAHHEPAATTEPARQDAPPPRAGGGQETAAKKPAANDKTASGGAAKTPARVRRSMEEWVQLATPVFRAEFDRLRQQPSGPEFAKAITAAGLGRVGPSTAKNIRNAILNARAKSEWSEADLMGEQ